MKICFVIPTLTSGGAERVAVTVLSGLDGRKYERALFVFSLQDAVYLDQVAPGVRVVVATKGTWFGRLRELADFLRDFNPDVVMPFLSYFITAVAVAVAGVRAALVFNQGTPTSGFLDDPDFAWRQPWRRRVFTMMTRFFYNRADAIVATSQGVADDLVTNFGVPATKIRVLHNPVDLDAIQRQAAEPVPQEIAGDWPVVVAAGRLAGVKNYPLLIEAVADVASRRPLWVWILGEGADRARLEAMAKAKGLGETVRFLGFQPNPFRFIARADLFVLTSAYEGFGNVLIEAMACGTAVVATRSPGTVEIVTSGDNGLLVEHEVQAVANAIGDLLSNDSKRDLLVSRARANISHYALPAVAGRYDRLFDELRAA